MSISELDRVRVVRTIPPARLHSRRPSPSCPPAIGDLGRVSFAYRVQAPNEPMFIVECMAADGSLRWLADLRASEIERVTHSVTPP